MKNIRLSLILAILVSALGVSAQNAQKYEMRAGWMASVANINWPAKMGLSEEELKKGFISYLDSLSGVNANAVVMQLRPTGDSFYPSSLEPWSIYLTGVQGQAPSPMWDPVAFMIEESHKRGFEFHAWLNPYRIAQHVDSTKLSSNHIIRQHPEWFVQYGNQWYFDPGQPGSAKYSTAVVKELVSRYDLDAIHFDDYFYPYKVGVRDTLKVKTADGRDTIRINYRNIDFPDTLSWEKYGKPFFKDKDAWRRNNVDQLIISLSNTIKSTKPWVKFGISPFGVWRNASTDPVRGSDSKAGVQNYDDLYADILLWSEKGWIDYVTPQLYWKIGRKDVDYPILLDWWIKYSYGKHLYVGHSMGNGTDEIENQIKILREKGFDKVQGSFYWNTASLLRSGAAPRKNTDPNAKPATPQRPMNTMLRSQNSHIALVPPMSWLDMTAPATPTNLKATGSEQNVKLTWDATYSDNLVYFLVYKFAKGEKIDTNNPANIIAKVRYDNNAKNVFYDESGQKGEFTYIITGLSRNNIESAPLSLTAKVGKTSVK